jgi:hypothetical protein
MKTIRISTEDPVKKTLKALERKEKEAKSRGFSEDGKTTDNQWETDRINYIARQY